MKKCNSQAGGLPLLAPFLSPRTSPQTPPSWLCDLLCLLYLVLTSWSPLIPQMTSGTEICTEMKPCMRNVMEFKFREGNGVLPEEHPLQHGWQALPLSLPPLPSLGILSHHRNLGRKSSSAIFWKIQQNKRMRVGIISGSESRAIINTISSKLIKKSLTSAYGDQSYLPMPRNMKDPVTIESDGEFEAE